MDLNSTSKYLRKTYLLLLLTAVMLLIIIYLIKHFEVFHLAIVSNSIYEAILISLSAIIGIAIPIFYRSYFVYKIRDKKEISTEVFLRFEKSLIIMALTSPYFLVLAFMTNTAQMTIMILTLISIYTGYYYFPSKKKIKFEMKIFRIKATETKTK